VIIDEQTLLLASGAVVTICAFSFVLNTVLRRNNAVGRTWSIAFIAGVLTTFSYAAWGLAPDAWWAVAVGNGAVALWVGALWAGSRQFNGRRSLLSVVFGVSLLVSLSGLFYGPDGGAWAGALEMFIAVSALAGLGGAETLRGRFKTSTNAPVLTVVLFLVAFYYVLRSILFVTVGPTDMVFLTYFGTVTTTFVSIVMVVLAAVSMSVLVANGPVAQEPSIAVNTRSIPGVFARTVFDVHAKDWLARARRDRDSLVLVILDIANLEHMNTAFGRNYGDQAIQSVGRIAVENSPSAALIGHLRGQRFIILTTAPVIGAPTRVAEHLQTAMVETPIDAIEGIRAIVTCGVATTDDSGYDLTNLQKAALGALTEASAAGPGQIRGAGSPPGAGSSEPTSLIA